MGAPRFVMEDFWPSDLFLGGIPGAWYDPTDVNVNWRRNLLTYTEQFDNAAWIKLNASASTNVTTAPDGTVTADALIEDAANTFHIVSRGAGSISCPGVGTFSCYLKASTRTAAVLQINEGANRYAALFDLTNGVVAATNTTGTPTSTSNSIASVGNGWYRCTVSCAIATTCDTIVALSNSLTPVWTSSVPTYAGNGTSGVFLWGAQLEVGSTASAYQQIVTPEITYAATQTTNLFQDSTGTTPVWAVEQPVGLILDKSQGLAQGSQLVVNGDGTTLTGWTTSDDAGCSSTVSGGQFVLSTVAGGAARLRQTIPTTAGKTYAVSIFCNTSASNATAAFTVWGAAYGITTLYSAPSVANGVITAIVQATSANIYLQLSAFSGSTGLTNFYDNVSVRELAGNHASQSTAASRPTYRARYNLLTFSEQFDNAAWTKGGLNTTGTPPWVDVTTAPDGTSTADRMIETVATTFRYVLQAATVVAGNYTFSVYAKQTGGAQRWLSMFPQGSTSAYAIFDINAGTVTSTGGANYVSSAVSSVGNGWFRCSVTCTSTAGTMNLVAYLSNSSTAQAPSYLGDGASGAFLWGAQLLTAADVTATGNAYQRIAAATVYDTAAVFRPYLAFDGVDDSLATAAINFTSTDKMTVFAGASKLSDAAAAILTELSATTASNAGSFYIAAPEATGASGNFTYKSRGSLDITPTSPGAYLAPTTRVLSGIGDIAGDTAILRINGAQAVNSTGDQGTGNYGNYPLFIGRRGGTTLPFNGRIYSLIVRGAASSVTEIADTELWVNARTGAY